jgi:Ni,Fe-hydrogenase III small subunit
MTQEFELAARDRGSLVLTAEYELNPDGTQGALKTVRRGEADADTVGQTVRNQIHKLLGRSLSIREVDAGSCNGCELEIHALNNAFYDLERFGLRFVASPRHADVLLVTGPVTRRMLEPLRLAYDAMPEPRRVAALGDCALGCGVLGIPEEIVGPLDTILPVDLRIPGCPPTPDTIAQALLGLIDAR